MFSPKSAISFSIFFYIIPITKCQKIVKIAYHKSSNIYLVSGLKCQKLNLHTRIYTRMPLPVLCSGYYMMVNTGLDILPSGAASVLSSPLRHGTARTECVHFWYHMGGGAYPGETLARTEKHRTYTKE